MTLVAVLADPVKKRAIVADAARLVDEEVAAKGGLSGVAIKAGYKSVVAIRPDLVSHALERLLPEFAPRIDPFYEKARASGDVKRWFSANAGPIADALLSVTDEKAKHAKHAVLLKVYNGLRGQAKHHTEAAVPRLADLIRRHVDG